MDGGCVGQGVLDANHWNINKKAPKKGHKVPDAPDKNINIMLKTKI